ncbi:unnamed protein product [Blepharisma stoltei]|uniref:Uncharacterized protein n=1 Tax=Blepharisma stoltei TaxID=1481888 RepID=A0AAU9JF15_9CILI|nr:unnamed protein product [Blepharisma stoltei]
MEKLILMIESKQSTILTVCDLEHKIISDIPIMIPINLTRFTCIAQLPNYELFCFGTEGIPSSGFACIIDLQNYSLKRRLTLGYPCYSSCALYYDGFVYIFGGGNNTKGDLPNFYKFDLQNNRWIKRLSLPISSHSCSSIIFRSNILVSGFSHKHLYQYNMELDSYSIAFSFESGNSWKILLAENNRAYIIERLGRIYECGAENVYNWNDVGKSSMDWFLQHYVTYYQNSAYIGINIGTSNLYYKFDFKTKKIQKFYFAS